MIQGILFARLPGHGEFMTPRGRSHLFSAFHSTSERTSLIVSHKSGNNNIGISITFPKAVLVVHLPLAVELFVKPVQAASLKNSLACLEITSSRNGFPCRVFRHKVCEFDNILTKQDHFFMYRSPLIYTQYSTLLDIKTKAISRPKIISSPVSSILPL